MGTLHAPRTIPTTPPAPNKEKNLNPRRPKPRTGFGFLVSCGLSSVWAFALMTLVLVAPALARDTVHIVGSSTVFPFSQAVAEEFTGLTEFSAPVVESTGTGGGFKLFCSGIGAATPDVTGASRLMKDSEKELCVENGVASVTEVRFGFDGLSIATSQEAQPLALTPRQIFLALAAEVPQDGNWIANPFSRWNEVDASLPNEEIIVFGPPPTSGTRDAFLELAVVPGCDSFAETKSLDKETRKQRCHRLRSDGPFIEAGENDNLIVQRLVSDPRAVGIFGLSFLEENRDKLRGVAVDGVEPSFETVRDRSYPLVRPLLVYVKNAHREVIPGLEDFVAAFVDEWAIGESGYLLERGLVPLEATARAETQEVALSAKPLF